MKVEIPQFVRTGIDTAHQKVVHPYLTRGKAKEDREIAHTRSLSLMSNIQDHESLMRITRELFAYEDPILETQFATLTLPNPLFMEAGFDKNAVIYRFLGEALGFGGVKVGTVTKRPYKGNVPPRIFDLPNSDGLINRMGFPGEGTDEVEKRLQEDNPLRAYKLVVSVGASRPSFENESQIADFIDAAKQMSKYGEAIEGNVSSPNTEGVRDLSEPAIFKDLSQGVKEVTTIDGKKVTLVIYKFSPDLDQDKRERDSTIAQNNGAGAITLGNTTTDFLIKGSLDLKDIHKMEQGGISGAPLREKALEISHRMYKYLGDDLPIGFSGGIASGEDLWNALTYGGAKAAGIYSSFVRPNTSTPNLAYYLLRDLARAMRRKGMHSMEDFKILRGKRVPYPLKYK